MSEKSVMNRNQIGIKVNTSIAITSIVITRSFFYKSIVSQAVVVIKGTEIKIECTSSAIFVLPLFTEIFSRDDCKPDESYRLLRLREDEHASSI